MAARCAASVRIDVADSSGASPGAMTMVPSIGPPLRSSRAARARRTACPVPSWVGWKTTIASGAIVGQVRLDLFARLAGDHHDVRSGRRRPSPSARGRACCGRRSRAAPSGSTTSCGCPRRPPARSRPRRRLSCGAHQRGSLLGVLSASSAWPAPGGGFEPPFTGPKPVVLPLDDPGSASAPRVRKSGLRPLAR